MTTATYFNENDLSKKISYVYLLNIDHITSKYNFQTATPRKGDLPGGKSTIWERKLDVDKSPHKKRKKTDTKKSNNKI